MKYLLSILCLFSFIFSEPEIDCDISNDDIINMSDIVNIILDN